MLCNLLLQANVKHPLNGINFPFRCNITHLSQALALPFSSEILHLQEKYFLQLVCMLNEWKLDDNFMQIFNFFPSRFTIASAPLSSIWWMLEQESEDTWERKNLLRWGEEMQTKELQRSWTITASSVGVQVTDSKFNFFYHKLFLRFHLLCGCIGEKFFFLSLFSFSFFWFAFEAEQKTHRLRDVCRRKKLQWRSREKFLPRRVSSFANSPCMRFLQIFTFCW